MQEIQDKITRILQSDYKQNIDVTSSIYQEILLAQVTSEFNISYPTARLFITNAVLNLLQE